MNATLEKIEDLRRQKKMTVTALSEATGINTSTMYMWRKRDNVPSLDHLIKIADALNVPISYFSEEEHSNVFTINLDALEGDRRKFAETMINIYLAGECEDEETFELVYKSALSKWELIQAIIDNEKK